MHLRLTLDHQLSVAELQQIDDACDRFESAWRRGDAPIWSYSSTDSWGRRGHNCCVTC